MKMWSAEVYFFVIMKLKKEQIENSNLVRIAHN